MAVSIEVKNDAARDIYYEVTLSADDDAFQAHLIADNRQGGVGALDWANGRVGWYRSADVEVTFTNAGEDAMALTGTDGVTEGWVDHPDAAERQSAETLPITGLRFKASAADQKVLLYTGRQLVRSGVSAVTNV